jgi:TolA-binding protein
MSDRPWLEDADPSLRVERSLLKKLNAQQPPSGSADHGWAALAAEIGALEALGAASGVNHAAQLHAAAHTVKGGASLILAAKIAAGVAVAGGVLWGGSALLSPDSGSVTTRHIAPMNAPASTPSVQEQSGEQVTGQSAEEDRAPVKAPQSAGIPRPASSATTLAEEGRLLAQAHQLVQSGNASQALEVLRLSASRYPRSVLYQEREVLTIEALGATGASGAARQRAERFLKRYPSSPHAGRLKRFVE